MLFTLHAQDYSFRSNISYQEFASTHPIWLNQIKSKYLFHPPNGNFFVLFYKKLNTEVMKLLTVLPETPIHPLVLKNLNAYTAAAIRLHQLVSQK